MSPTHANKKGVRYRYYTSHALLQRRNEHAGSVPRVPAPDVEARVCEALRREKAAAEISDRDLIAANVVKVIIRRDRIEIELQRASDRQELGSAGALNIPFSPILSSQKGLTREPPLISSDPHPPRGAHVSDDRLASRMDVDVLDRDFLLAFAAVAVQSFYQEDVSS